MSVAAALLAAACATTGTSPAPTVAVESGLSVSQRMTLAIDLLNHGQRDQARAELRAIIKAAPTDAAALQLLSEMDQDPQVTLGSENFPYIVRPGETLAGIAERFLGDPLKFDLLARYNAIAAPAELAAGQKIMIPGVAPRPVVRHEPPARPEVSAPPPPTPVVIPPPAQPARARALRAAALESLNRGQINRAVGLLNQAAQLDPANAAIKRDLAKAQRIQATVNGR